MGLTNSSVYCHFSSNNYNSRQLRQNIHKNFKNHSQEITLHSYIQHSRLIALSTVCFVLLSTDAHSTVTSLERLISPFAVPQFQSPLTLPSTVALHYKQHTDLPLHYCPYLAVRWPWMICVVCCLLHVLLLFQSVLYIPFSNFLPRSCKGKSGILAALRSEASHFVTLIGYSPLLQYKRRHQ